MGFRPERAAARPTPKAHRGHARGRLEGTPGQPTDEELLERFSRGEAAAFEQLYARYRRQIFTYVLRSARDTAAAEELTQDIFMRVLERAEDFRGQSKFSTWLYSITRNLCVDHSRKMSFRRHRSLDAPLRRDEAGGATLGDQTEKPQVPTDRQVESESIRGRLTAAIEALPEDQREVFLLRQVENVPFAEIASIVGISENTAKSRMRYALERLQKALAEYEESVRDVG
jgi:RNA polymerase sigma-70 factor (ECF subfamily)